MSTKLTDEAQIIYLKERVQWLGELSQVRAGVITEKDKRITALEAELQEARAEIAEHRCLSSYEQPNY